MVNAHDLLWGMTLAHLPADAPAWVRAVIAAAHPVVVRRALAEPGYVAVGVRGRLREQRFAAVMPMAAVQRRVTPEALCGVISPRDLPALRALDQLRPVLARKVWGVTGSAGFELATGIEALHAQSDLDLLLRTPERLERGEAEALLAILDTAPCAVDLQLQTPYGAVALREWAGPARRVLLKTASGAQLVSDPWQAVA
ncbi:malonate decarboxylase holo-ACP synthase [Pseudomonas gessardii]|uniref:Malonate decarboxylase holo-ACP synthase n=1 Tax=Pseudomonas gessardii TaxID=78544 RepID=A0ABS9F2Y5_9PSED|nr:malonate decarboxylase holo-ACP synthase [Pseudomonas gessardii]MCF4977424.1 malonate decarboxylase holo-ACP synthase [Pseudomonas gessardii]MCF4987844.1 malonate decarboxylase holo-ACP synthase [Pseudomonas gessardii]MCF5083115.1 malonate decarboxylase holo-ACP synthase [Pseudomonas gessardii]MCF5094874.1 malonate decarboxylase holo-ACP synthase [Pseudomonas gessardii]MCF5106750.1 malonate decarboxylase holo-ACP synthase [Pseudomonas gessardii]